MSGFDDLKQLLGVPSRRSRPSGDWTDVERYVGSALPSDFKAFMDAYGAGVIESPSCAGAVAGRP
jgi:hypothetical protein